MTIVKPSVKAVIDESGLVLTLQAPQCSDMMWRLRPYFYLYFDAPPVGDPVHPG